MGFYYTCRVNEAWWENVIKECRCIEIEEDESCQLRLEVDNSSEFIKCKSDATMSCRIATLEWADAYKNAPNINNCKQRDVIYKYSQDTARNGECFKLSRIEPMGPDY